MSGGGGETTQSTEPWEGVRPYLKDIYARVGRGTGGLASAGGGRPGRTQSAIDADIARYESQLADPGLAEMSPNVRSGLEARLRSLRDEQPVAAAAGGGGGAAGTPALIDQPLLIHDPVGFTAPERAAQWRMIGIARGGTPELLGQTSDELGRTIGGEYLGANPYLEGMYEAASRPIMEDFTEQVLPALTGQFAAAGRGESGMQSAVQQGATEDLTRNLADMSSNLYGRAYETERDRMMQAMGLAPGVAGMERDIDLANAQLFGDVGMARREMREARRAAEEARAREPWERMQLAAQLYGAGSPFTMQSQPYHRNRLAGGLGGAATGASIGAGAGPYGAAIGAGIGGLAGLMTS